MDTQNIDISEILQTAPDFVQMAPKEQQDIYIDYEVKRRELDTCPDRFMTYKGNEGKLYTIDLKYINIRAIMLKNGAQDDAIDDAFEIRQEIVLPLMQQFNRAKTRYFNAFDLYNDKKRALAKLTPVLLDLFGTMHSIRDVKKILRQKEGYDLGDEELIQFFNENKTTIESRQQKYIIHSDKYRVATEAGRLEIINDILTDMQLKYEYYIEKNQESRAIAISKEIRNLLEQARKEVKGNELKLTVDGKIDIGATLHGQQNIGRIMREVPINSIVIGLVAAKTGLRAETLVSQLAQSWYKDFNGFNKNILGDQKVELPGDLIKMYDWKELEKENTKFLQEMAEDIQTVDTEEDKKQKQSLIDRLRRMKKVVQKDNKNEE